MFCFLNAVMITMHYWKLRLLWAFPIFAKYKELTMAAFVCECVCVGGGGGGEGGGLYQYFVIDVRNR